MTEISYRGGKRSIKSVHMGSEARDC
jgi:hypothetical protein